MATKLDFKEEIIFRFARKIASNEPLVRSRSLKQLKSFLKNLTDDIPDLTMMKLWKGLHYSLWMADKMLFQEQLAENISCIIHTLPSSKLSMKFFDSFLQIEGHEWHLIDDHRIDKFLMLVRFMFRETFKFLKNSVWSKEVLEEFCRSLSQIFMNSKVSLSLLFHIIELFLGELLKVSNSEHSENFITEVTRAFVEVLSKTENEYLAKEIKKNYLLKLSDPDYKMDQDVLCQLLFSTASKKICKNRSIIFTLIKQLKALHEERSPNAADSRCKKDSKRKREFIDVDAYQAEIPSAIERLQDFNSNICEDKTMKRMKRRMEKKMRKKMKMELQSDDADNIEDEDDDDVSTPQTMLKNNQFNEVNDSDVADVDDGDIINDDDFNDLEDFVDDNDYDDRNDSMDDSDNNIDDDDSYESDGNDKKQISNSRVFQKKLTKNNLPLKKRVSFIMKNNKAKRFKKATKVTPRFNPDMKPVKGVLKSPVLSSQKIKSKLKFK